MIFLLRGERGQIYGGHWYDSTPEKSRRKRDSNRGPSALEADALTTRPTRRSLYSGLSSKRVDADSSNNVHRNWRTFVVFRFYESTRWVDVWIRFQREVKEGSLWVVTPLYC